jgi:Flp pilus assembly protein CpaB
MPENKKILQLLASGIMALLFIQFYLKSKEQNIELGFDMVNVLVAGQDIPPNHAITADLVTTKTVAGRDVEPGAFRVKIPGEALKRVIGKVTMSAIPGGGQILLTNLRNASARDTGISPMLPPGKRGYVLRLGNLDVAKLILPGDHIDILATFTVRQKGSDATSKVTYTILQNIQVVAVDKDIIQAGRDVTGKAEITEGRLLTLAVSPVEAEQLAHSQIESGGEISVVVRPSGDEGSSPIAPVTASNLLSGPPPAAHVGTIKNH